MINLNQKNQLILDLLTHSYYSTKIEIYMSTKVAGSDFDPWEKKYTETNLNPHFIKGYVRDIKAEALVWKQYGLAEIGAKEIICQDKYGDWFRNCAKIKIGTDTFAVYKEGQGNRALIEQRPCGMIRVILKKET
jgi:hypothetical protein